MLLGRPGPFLGFGLTRSIEGGLDEVDESFVAFAKANSSSATRFISAATRVFSSSICRSLLFIAIASGGCDDKSMFDGFRLALTVQTEDEADKAFNALAEGGSIQMPLCTTFWSPCYGMVADKFNVGWMVMVPGEMPA